MATLAVAASSAALGPVGTVLAYTAAAYVDSLWIGTLTKPDPVKGPKIGSLELNTADDGAPVQEAYGRIARAAGHLLDVSELIETQDTTTNNGKGGGGAAYVEYSYAVHAMVSFGLGPAEKVSKIRANGRTIYNEDPDVDITSTAIEGTATTLLNNGFFGGVGSSSSVPFVSATWTHATTTLTLVFTGTTVYPIQTYWKILFTDAGGTGLSTSIFYSVTGGTVTVGASSVTYALTLNTAAAPSTIDGTVDGVLVRNPQSSTPQGTQYLRLDSANGGPDLSAVTVGGNKLQIIAPANNVGSWEVVESGTNADGSTYCKVKKPKNSNPFQSITLGATVQIFQENPQWSPKVMAEAPEFHRGPTSGLLGAYDQPVDTLFEALRGTGEIPAYRGKIVVTFKGLQLFDFGNTLPQFEADIVQSSTATVGDFLEAQAVEAGFSADQVDASAITNPLLGMVVRGPQQVTQKLTPLMMGYELMTWEDEGVLRFFYRKDAQEVALSADLLGAHEPGSSAPRPARFSDGDDDPPTRYVVRYLDEDRDWQVGTQQGFRQSEGAGQTQTIDLGTLGMEAADAKALATHMAWLAPVNRRRVEFNVPISQVDTIREGVRVNVTLGGRDREVLVLGVDRGPNGVLEVDGFLEQSSIFELLPDPESGGSSLATLLGSGTQHGSGSAQPVLWAALDLPALSDEQVRQPGLYIAATLEGDTETFSGAALFQASDEDGESWAQVLRVRTAAVMGIATALPSAPVGFLDETSTVDVVLFNGELESVRELALLNGANRALIGGEIVGFRSAELIGTNTYRLSGLLRGLRGTEGQTAHLANELFVLLTGPGIHFLPLETASIGMEKRYKLLTAGMRLADADEYAYTCTGQTASNFAPTHVEGQRDGSDNLTISWTRVSRANVRLLSTQAVPVVEPFERYEVDVLDSNGDVLRTISASANVVNYTAAQQTADGLTPGDPVSVVVYQSGDIVARGAGALVTL